MSIASVYVLYCNIYTILLIILHLMIIINLSYYTTFMYIPILSVIILTLLVDGAYANVTNAVGKIIRYYFEYTPYFTIVYAYILCNIIR